MAAEPHLTRVVVAIEPASRPLRAEVSVDGGPAKSYRGWLGVLAALQDAHRVGGAVNAADNEQFRGERTDVGG